MSMTLRAHLDQQLTDSRSEIVEMGNIAIAMIEKATDAILSRDSEAAHEVVGMDDRVDQLEFDLTHKLCLQILQTQPVASDLRFLAASLGIIGEIEKIADEAVKLSKRYLKLSEGLPAELRIALVEMSNHARQAFGASLRLFMDYSPTICEEVKDSEQRIDAEFKSVRSRIFDMIRSKPEASVELLRAIELFHALEHVGDHAAEIASRLEMHYAPESVNS